MFHSVATVSKYLLQSTLSDALVCKAPEHGEHLQGPVRDQHTIPLLKMITEAGNKAQPLEKMLCLLCANQLPGIYLLSGSLCKSLRKLHKAFSHPRALLDAPNGCSLTVTPPLTSLSAVCGQVNKWYLSLAIYQKFRLAACMLHVFVKHGVRERVVRVMRNLNVSESTSVLTN